MGLHGSTIKTLGYDLLLQLAQHSMLSTRHKISLLVNVVTANRFVETSSDFDVFPIAAPACSDLHGQLPEFSSNRLFPCNARRCVHHWKLSEPVYSQPLTRVIAAASVV